MGEHDELPYYPEHIEEPKPSVIERSMVITGATLSASKRRAALGTCRCFCAPSLANDGDCPIRRYPIDHAAHHRVVAGRSVFRSYSSRAKARRRGREDVRQGPSTRCDDAIHVGRPAPDARASSSRPSRYSIASLPSEKRALGPSDPEVAATVLSLAQLCLSMARYAEAETYLSRVLYIRVRTLGSDHPDTGMASITLARLRQQQGRLDEAEALNREALGLFEKALGSDHVYVSVALNNLAQVHKMQGRLSDVETDLLRALQIFEKKFGPESHAIAPMLNNLGELRRIEGRYAEAEAFYRREFAITEKALGPDHPELATSLGNLGTLLVRQGRIEDAEKSASSRIWRSRRRLLAPTIRTSPLASTTWPMHSTILSDQARLNPLLRRSLAVREKNFGQDHASVAVALDNLATHLHKQARFAEALPLATLVIERSGSTRWGRRSPSRIKQPQQPCRALGLPRPSR